MQKQTLTCNFKCFCDFACLCKNRRVCKRNCDCQSSTFDVICAVLFQSLTMDKLTVKLQWMDYLNHNWLKEDVIRSLYDRKEIKKLYNILIQNKEVSFVTNSALLDQEMHLSHFEKNFPSFDEQKHYIDALLTNQVIVLVSKGMLVCVAKIAISNKIYHFLLLFSCVFILLSQL